MQKHFCTGKRPAIMADVECFDADTFSPERNYGSENEPTIRFGKTPVIFYTLKMN